MKVAVLYDYLETVGGGERVALTLANGIGADLITTEFDPGLPKRAGFDGVRVTSLGGLLRGPPMKQLHATWRFSRAHLPGYDFYVLIGNWAHFAGRAHHPNLYYCLTPTRSLYDHRSAVLARLPPGRRAVGRALTRFLRSLDRRAVRHCDRILAISENVRSRVRRWYRMDADVVYPPVATSRFRFIELGDTWLSVNRLYPEKRVDLQVEVFRQLPTEKLVIVGGYARGDFAEAYVSSLRPPPNVTFLGEIPEAALAALYGHCRGFLATAVDEDFGITPLEAMAAGKCVLATDEGGYRETVVPGKTGFLLPPDPETFAAKIRGLDEAALLSMRNACVARAREFDESAFLTKMRAVIERAAAEGSPR